ncbi:MAG: tRNA (adenosine(37)-N6)-dimethylallyltransferase MiaA [candidate division Zixibacteria bacterium]|nr:tRNA (adenosine(37)-N6)-dimethylallyltransferase MiaA [candidate division Zixibacteria bacterium]
MFDEKIRIAIISGPTASGKSSLALAIAQEFNAEIISADSRQIYRQLKIGTDRLSENEWQGVPHHLMGSHDLSDKFTAFGFVDAAEIAVTEARKNGKHIIICGGTGMYIRAFADGIFEMPDGDTSYRSELLDLASKKGPKFIHEMLMEVDPEEASKVHFNNMIRVIRALEIYNLTGKPKSEIVKNTAPRDKNYIFKQVILTPPRDILYKRIEARVDEMFVQGLVEEVKLVYNSEYGKALHKKKIVGYSEIIEYLDGHCTLEEAKLLVKQNTRRYAKRQFTWFRNVKNADFITAFGSESIETGKGLFHKFWQ